MKNYKLILLVWLISFFIPQMLYSQTSGFSEEELPILVKRLYQWSKDYPTVTNNWNGMLATVESGEIPTILSVITEINGKSTKNMTEDEFYSILMSDYRCKLNYQKKVRGEIKSLECSLSYHKHLYWQGGLGLEWPEDFPANVKYTVDRRVEFFKYLTFDCMPNSNSEIEETAILDVVSRALKGNGMVRTSENPDLIIKMDLTKVDGNGVTCAVCVLDAKTDCEVWRLDYSGLNGTFDKIFKAIKANIGTHVEIFPFAEPTYSYKLTTAGVAFESHDEMYMGRVVHVLPGCDAYNKGLRGGDIVLKGYFGGEYNITTYEGRKIWFKAGKKQGHKNFSFSMFGPIPFPFYKTNDVERFLLDYQSSFASSSKSHFVVKKTDGTKVKMASPMQCQTYNLVYIR